MKMQIIGLEGSTGIGKTSGNAYEIGQIHSIAPLAPPLGKDNVAQGAMGTTYKVGVAIIKALAHIPLPFVADVDVRDVMRFGKREQEVFGVVPLSAKAAA